MDIANIRPGMLVLEPEAGRGDIAFACIDAGAIVDCYELMQANFDFLASSGRFNSVHHMDFLEATPEPIYDRIVMNPPFLKQADIKHVQHALHGPAHGIPAGEAVVLEQRVEHGLCD